MQLLLAVYVLRVLRAVPKGRRLGHLLHQRRPLALPKLRQLRLQGIVAHPSDVRRGLRGWRPVAAQGKAPKGVGLGMMMPRRSKGSISYKHCGHLH